MSDSIESLPFEKALERLEEIVHLLEKGDTSLEESIRLFDEGMKLAHHCQKKLKWAEQQVEILVNQNGEWVKKPFKLEEDSD